MRIRGPSDQASSSPAILLTDARFLRLWRPSVMLDTMKTLTTREFFHSPSIVKALRSGESAVVTDNGKPALVVTKAGKRPRKTRADLEREAREICPKAYPKVNFTAALKELKGR